METCSFQQITAKAPQRRRGRVAEGNGLLNRHTLQGVSRVRIPPSPPFFQFHKACVSATVPTFEIYLVATPGLEGALCDEARARGFRSPKVVPIKY
jgi:hypothetical protein